MSKLALLVELVVAGHPGDGHESSQLEGAVVQGLVSHQFHRLHRQEELLIPWHGLINFKETNAKCRYLKKLTCKGTLRQGLSV